jgi:hypothetical protein
MGNVLSWRQALDQGFNPGIYSYSDVPLGEYSAILDFKIWAKKVMAINCYFTQIDTEKKIQLTVYCNEAGIYKPGSSDVNFATCPINRMYRINVITNQKKKIVFTHAELFELRQE